jgi:hypothetical protein
MRRHCAFEVDFAAGGVEVHTYAGARESLVNLRHPLQSQTLDTFLIPKIACTCTQNRKIIVIYNPTKDIY